MQQQRRIVGELPEPLLRHLALSLVVAQLVQRGALPAPVPGDDEQEAARRIQSGEHAQRVAGTVGLHREVRGVRARLGDRAPRA